MPIILYLLSAVLDGTSTSKNGKDENRLTHAKSKGGRKEKEKKIIFFNRIENPEPLAVLG